MGIIFKENFPWFPSEQSFCQGINLYHWCCCVWPHVWKLYFVMFFRVSATSYFIYLTDSEFFLPKSSWILGTERNYKQMLWLSDLKFWQKFSHWEINLRSCIVMLKNPVFWPKILPPFERYIWNIKGPSRMPGSLSD